jgi:hypothetical protein
MSWRKKKKEMRKIKHKAGLIVCLMFAVVIGLIVLLTVKILNFNTNNFKVESRVEELKNEKPIDGSGYKAIGWLKIQGTDIDLPVVYSDNENESFPVKLESFVWARKNFDKNSNYYNITGHNIFNLSATPKIKSDNFHRFEQLMAFVYYDFAKDNEYIQLTIDDEDYVYKIFATSFINKGVTSFFPNKSDASKNEIDNLIELVKNRSLYEYDVDVNANDKIISLSTCTRFYGPDDNTEFYVLGRLLRDDEKINHYKVTENKNYKKIKNILKGDENNE